MKYLKLFENWNSINEGITFGIKDYGKTTSVDAEGNITSEFKPELNTIHDICWALKSEVWKHNLVSKYKIDKFEYNDIDFEPDGGDAFEKTGIINLYTNLSDKERLEKVIKVVQEFSAKNKLKLGKLSAEIRTEDRSVKLHTKGEPIDKIRVIRIPIIENLNQEEEIQTELHVSNSTAQRILRKMGFDVEDDDYVFNLPARDILRRAESGKRYGGSGQSMTHTSSVDKEILGKLGGNIHNGASDASDNSHIDVLADMARYAIQNGYDTIQGS
jgi:hypothetical protein